MRIAGTKIDVYQYMSASDFAEWVDFEFDVNKNNAYQMLLNNDYMEGGLGSRYTKPVEINNEIDGWYAKFLDVFELEEIQLKYGD